MRCAHQAGREASATSIASVAAASASSVKDVAVRRCAGWREACAARHQAGASASATTIASVARLGVHRQRCGRDPLQAISQWRETREEAAEAAPQLQRPVCGRLRTRSGRCRRQGKLSRRLLPEKAAAAAKAAAEEGCR